MTLIGWIQIILYCAIIIALVKPLGWYMTRVFNGERTFLSPVLRPVEAALYWAGGVDEKREQHWLTYTVAMLFFHVGGFLILYGLMRFQAVLPFNPAEQSAVAAALAAAAQEGAGNRMSFFSPNLKIDHPRVVAAIAAAEQLTSGEIRVVIARHSAADAVVAAQRHFERLGMTHTRQRNGVLIYLAPRSRTFAMIGDTAVHEKCGDAFWRLLTAAMALHFKRGEFTDGLIHGIERAGSLLAEHFPRGTNDRDELSNGIEDTD